ncbi:efflux RND transporter periplasmic adaptor subunit [Candidatus Methylomicrobium oryzae]|jgi:Cu(I)/Ag(I) efflux system membrane fusion protein|uniref:efflux RND transporter periplasmic adaptor subunit n=1 Tax=Candidatus Methylomicrobium oryzae TaxID=2802053 RepID=UPI0019216488|nr:efflux RND transporter periplasmic adaptor subunit [Methylomicrobium sp. RS1]MBL1262499.1 efflux RND transporter periplasmic adaptor subunit [Methylomicrobium sp. RS1]
MKQSLLGTALIACGLGVLGGYWLASRLQPPASPPDIHSEKKPAFYRHPMNPSITSKVPAKDEMGMDYVPVYESEAKQEKAPADIAPSQPGKILYYRHPMGLPDTSPVPKKDAMGMDYIPVYAEADDSNEAPLLRLSTEKIQRLGVKTAPVENTEIAKTIRSVGIIEADERRLYNVTLRFDGFIEKLYANATGQPVTRGQPLFELYSPDLITAQNEYLLARQSQSLLAEGRDWVQSGVKSLAESSLERLENWGISANDLGRLRQGEMLKTVVVRSPASGVILEKTAVAGARAMAGDTLFKIADLSRVWAMAEVYEQDIGSIKAGQTARVTLDAYPGKTFTGKVGFVYPMLNAATRTVKVRVELANPGQLLKPMMYAQLQIDGQKRRALTVPTSAVLESGRRTLALVDRGGGRFEPRPVEAGLRGEERIEILKGLQERERVVFSANFLIDAESNLKAAVSAFETVDTKQDSTVAAEPSRSHGEHSHQGGR